MVAEFAVSCPSKASSVSRWPYGCIGYSVEISDWPVASWNSPEQAWESVARYFPPQESEQNNYYALRSEQRLAELDRERDDLERAAERYQHLLEAETGDDEFRAIGLAGLANVHMLRSEQSQAHKQLAALGLLLNRLPPEVQQLIRADIDPRLRPELQRLSRDLRAAPESE